MAAAGLTHGGFYRHFRNKEQLVAEALSAAGDMSIAVVGRNIGKGGVNAAVDSYLSTSHRDSPSPICPFAALGSEMARAGEETKAAATEVLERLFDPWDAVDGLAAGELDWGQEPPLDFFPKIEQNSDLQKFIFDPLGVQGWLRPNCLHLPFNNKKARQSLLH